jgi:hypothetical protein
LPLVLDVSPSQPLTLSHTQTATRRSKSVLGVLELTEIIIEMFASKR